MHNLKYIYAIGVLKLGLLLKGNRIPADPCWYMKNVYDFPIKIAMTMLQKQDF